MHELHLSTRIVTTILPSGERMPVLVHDETSIPFVLPLRWAMRYRRFKVQSSTLANNLRTIGHLYMWAHNRHDLDLDQYLTSSDFWGSELTDSLTDYLRQQSASPSTSAISNNLYNNHLYIAKDFLTWCLHKAYRGGHSPELHATLARKYLLLDDYFRMQRMRSAKSGAREPLESYEMKAIREAIGPYKNDDGSWQFPSDVFDPKTRLRNWLIFELCAWLGIRTGELLKLKLSSLPRGNSTLIEILRNPDDPDDPRTMEPAVKSAERAIPAPKELLRQIEIYISAPLPMGRPKNKSAYLFLSHEGNPLTTSTMSDIKVAIARYSKVAGFTWHRLRHTWAERVADILVNYTNGPERLRYLGGWASMETPTRYIKRSIAKQSNQMLQEYQNMIYDEYTEQLADLYSSGVDQWKT